MSLKERALLVDLDIGLYKGEMRDRDSEQVIKKHYGVTAAKAAHVKKILVDSVYLDNCITWSQDIYKFHRAITAAWNDGGVRILSAHSYHVYIDRIRNLKLEFYKAVDELYDNWDSIVKQEVGLRGGMVTAGQYPTKDEVKACFYVKVKFMPVPGADDFRCQIDDKDKEAIQQELEASVKEQQDKALAETWEKVYKPLKALAGKLEGFGTGSRLHDSILSNVLDMAEVLPMLNIHQDKVMDDLATEIKVKLAGANTEDLKKDQEERLRVLGEVKRLMQAVETAQGGQQDETEEAEPPKEKEELAPENIETSQEVHQVEGDEDPDAWRRA